MKKTRLFCKKKTEKKKKQTRQKIKRKKDSKRRETRASAHSRRNEKRKVQKNRKCGQGKKNSIAKQKGNLVNDRSTYL
jgi:hypothetical protein